MAFAIVFVSIIFLVCLGVTIFAPRWIKKPLPPNKIYFFEELWLGVWLGGGETLKPGFVL